MHADFIRFLVEYSNVFSMKNKFIVMSYYLVLDPNVTEYRVTQTDSFCCKQLVAFQTFQLQ